MQSNASTASGIAQFQQLFYGDQKGDLYFRNTVANQHYDKALSLYSRMHEPIQQQIFRKEIRNTCIFVEMLQQRYFSGGSAARSYNSYLGHIYGKNIRSIPDLETIQFSLQDPLGIFTKACMNKSRFHKQVADLETATLNF